MDELTTTQGIVALAAAGVAVIALLLGIVLATKLRRLRAAQRAVLGDGEQRDLVGHAARLEAGFVDLRDWVEEAAAGLDARRSGVVISSISHRDQARVYVKQILEGESEIELSPEEQEAIDTALGGAKEAPARA